MANHSYFDKAKEQAKKAHESVNDGAQKLADSDAVKTVKNHAKEILEKNEFIKNNNILSGISDFISGKSKALAGASFAFIGAVYLFAGGSSIDVRFVDMTTTQENTDQRRPNLRHDYCTMQYIVSNNTDYFIRSLQIRAEYRIQPNELGYTQLPLFINALNFPRGAEKTVEIRHSFSCSKIEGLIEIASIKCNMVNNSEDQCTEMVSFGRM